MIPHTQNKEFFFPILESAERFKLLFQNEESAPPKTNPEWKAWKTGNIISKLRPPQCKTSAAIFSERNPKYWACVCMHMRTGHTHTHITGAVRFWSHRCTCCAAASEHWLGCIWSSSGCVGRLNLQRGKLQQLRRGHMVQEPGSMERWREQSFEEHCKSCFRNEISVGWFLDEHAFVSTLQRIFAAFEPSNLYNKGLVAQLQSV